MATAEGRGRKLLWMAAAGCAIFLALQFVRPGLSNPAVTAEIDAPAEVKAILRNSCYSCHSNETKLPWFDRVVPAYWLVRSDVLMARKRLNFSEIGAQPPAKQRAMLYEGLNQVLLGAMPLPSYLAVHRGAVVTPEQAAVLRAYLTPAGPMPATSAADVAAADEEYRAWVGNAAGQMQVKDAPNGMKFIPDYKNWKEISTTERFDNDTMRVILGNDVAVRAIAAGHINPWPDGTIFAKVAWHQQHDGQGMARPGKFLQVEFMVRDHKKYVSTLGWGWGRWLGTELKPYGKAADFSNECVGCHLPVRLNDSVYTFPIPGHMSAASLGQPPGRLPGPRGGRP